MSRWLLTASVRRAMAIEDLQELAKGGVYTHPGNYHADDIVSACMLKLSGIIKSYDQIQRDVLPENFQGLAFDVGKGKYDHHQKDVKLHEDKSKYAACTLLAEDLFSQEVYDKIYNNFLQGIERTDNNGQQKYPNKFSHAVRSCNELHIPFVKVCEMFEEPVRVAMAGEIPELTSDLNDVEEKFLVIDKEQTDKANKVIAENEGKEVVELQEFIPAFKFEESGIKLLITQSNRTPGVYNIGAVPGYKIPDEIQSYPGFLFLAHNFLAGFKTREDALNAAEQIVNKLIITK